MFTPLDKRLRYTAPLAGLFRTKKRLMANAREYSGVCVAGIAWPRQSVGFPFEAGQVEIESATYRTSRLSERMARSGWHTEPPLELFALTGRPALQPNRAAPNGAPGGAEKPDRRK